MSDRNHVCTELVYAKGLRLGDLVDPESCPYLASHLTAENEYATVDFLEQEPGYRCVVGYEGIGPVSYRPYAILLRVRAEYNRNFCKA